MSREVKNKSQLSLHWNWSFTKKNEKGVVPSTGYFQENSGNKLLSRVICTYTVQSWGKETLLDDLDITAGMFSMFKCDLPKPDWIRYVHKFRRNVLMKPTLELARLYFLMCKVKNRDKSLCIYVQYINIYT